MRMHCVIHAAFERPGYFETWANDEGFHISFTHVDDGEKLPSSTDYDFLLLMGGPQSPHDVDKYSYLADEMRLIKESIEQDKYVLGICLGAQLIAESLGGKTEQGAHKEVGVFPITLTEEGKQDPLFKDFPNTFEVGHWHNDMPGVPEGAVVLAKSEGCPRQIIRFAPNVYGFQCHMEFNRACADALITNCPNDLAPGKYIQTASEILSSNFEDINRYLSLFLEQFISNSKN